jgi:hypothetical protein
VQLDDGIKKASARREWDNWSVRLQITQDGLPAFVLHGIGRLTSWLKNVPKENPVTASQ